MSKFNYFTILAKDDKELIHSSFIRFLLQDEQVSDLFLQELFPQFNSILNKASVNLETVYSYKEINEKGEKVGKRIRLDLEGTSVDGTTLLVIENKFKSFPYEEQLKTYDDRFAEEHNNKNIVKYLLCFDTSIIPPTFNKRNWNFISYNDLLNTLKIIIEKTQLEKDKRTFIEHYIQFLSERFQKYEEVKQSCAYLFFNGRDDENKFWIRHINAIARLKLEQYFTENRIPVWFTVNPGNASVPLLDIFPHHWNRSENVNVLIQVQDNNLKYYYHSNDHSELNQLIESTKKGIENSNGKFNKLSPNRGKTNFIYQEKLDKSIDNKPFTVDDFSNRIIAFYEKVDQVARKRFDTFVDSVNN